MKKPWYKSKTKIGSLLVALGFMLEKIPEVSNYAPVFFTLGTAIGGFGIRDAFTKP